MGIMTISISDQTEKRFRKAVKSEFGSGKGKIGQAAEAAFSKWLDDKERRKIATQGIALLGKFKMGKWKPVSRTELHERQ